MQGFASFLSAKPCTKNLAEKDRFCEAALNCGQLTTHEGMNFTHEGMNFTHEDMKFTHEGMKFTHEGMKFTHEDI